MTYSFYIIVYYFHPLWNALVSGLKLWSHWKVCLSSGRQFFHHSPTAAPTVSLCADESLLLFVKILCPAAEKRGRVRYLDDAKHCSIRCYSFNAFGPRTVEWKCLLSKWNLCIHFSSDKQKSNRIESFKPQ